MKIHCKGAMGSTVKKGLSAKKQGLEESFNRVVLEGVFIERGHTAGATCRARLLYQRLFVVTCLRTIVLPDIGPLLHCCLLILTGLHSAHILLNE